MRTRPTPLLHLALAALLHACSSADAQASRVSSGAASPAASSTARSYSTACASAPTVTSVTASTGTEAGGTSVTVGGTCLTGATGITFGGVAGTSVVVVDATTATVTTPAYTAALSSTAASNAVDVVATTGLGSGTLTGGYTYTSELARIVGALYSNEYRANDPAISVVSDHVATWPDFNANGDFTEATNRPDYSAVFNSGPSVIPDGTNDHMTQALGTTIANPKRPYVYIVGSYVTGTGYIYNLSDATESSSYLEFEVGAGHWKWWRGDSSGGTETDSGAATDTNRHLFRHAYTTGGTATLRIDTTEYDSVRTGTVVTAHPITKMVMGSTVGGASFTKFKFAHILILSDEPSSQQDADIVAFLKSSAFYGGYASNSYGLP